MLKIGSITVFGREIWVGRCNLMNNPLNES